mmetsp:Transcript_44082/g.47740  ORF Transcript_44082/g.47740 Transcript_44082/m.47740 type:complete len:87 (+) Transcript_44082:462-722(+)
MYFCTRVPNKWLIYPKHGGNEQQHESIATGPQPQQYSSHGIVPQKHAFSKHEYGILTRENIEIIVQGDGAIATSLPPTLTTNISLG